MCDTNKITMFCMYFPASTADEEDDLLDEIIPHALFKRKFVSAPKRQFIESPVMGPDEGQFMPMPQGGSQQFAGGASELFSEKMDQFSSPILQQQQLPPQNIIEQQAAQEQTLPPQEQTLPPQEQALPSQEQALPPQPEIQTLSQAQQGTVMQESPMAEISQQTTNDGTITELPENAKNYNANAVIETTLSDNGYKVTTDAREKANNLAKDVKNFGLWEYSADNTAPSTDQTAKILQSKLDEADALLKEKDSASLNSNQVDNAQGNKVDEILNLFNKGANNQGLEDLHSDAKGLEGLDTATKGYTGLGDGEKSMDLLGTGKSVSGQLGENDATIEHDVGALENTLANQGASTGGGGSSHEGVSIVTIPNTFSLEDEHGNKLDAATAGVRGGQKSEKQKAMQFLKKLLKNKLESQALKMLLRQKKLKAALKPSMSPTQSLREQLNMFVNHNGQGSSNEHSEQHKGPNISKMDVKLLHFIKSMLRKGIKPRTNKGLSDGQLKLFMSALKVLNKNSREEEEENIDEDSVDKETDKEKDADKEKEADKQKEADKGKEADKEKEVDKVKEVSNENKEAENNKEKKPSESKEKEKEEKETLEEKKKLRAKKLKDIQLLIEHIKPTSRSSHSFFMDEDQPLSESEGMSSNSLMKYLEHETALLDQFQEGSQISDPALQLKQLAGLMLKVANKAQAKDEYVDARRTTVRPTEDGVGEDGEKSEHDDKAMGSKAEKGVEEDGKDKKEEEKGIEEGKNEDGKEGKNKEKTDKMAGKMAGKESVKKESKSEEENEGDKQEDKEKQKEGKDVKGNKEQESKGKLTDTSGKEIMSANKGNQKEGKERSNKNIEKEKEKDALSQKGKENTEGRSNRPNKVKEMKNIPEVDQVRINGKPVEKIEKEKEKESPKFKGEGEKDDKDVSEGKTEENEGGKDGRKDGEKVKQLKGLPELNKLRNNKKIVSKVNGSDKEAESFKGGNEETSEEPKNHENLEEDGKDAKLRNKDGGSKDKSQDATEEFHLYVGSGKYNKSMGVEGNVLGSHILKPQLPFLNPGSAHQDVLENDASLKQYLMQKGDKNGGLRKTKNEAAQNIQGNDPESFDNKDNDRLLQVKDVTATKSYSSKNARLDVDKNSGSAYQINERKTRPNAVPPAGQGNPLSAVNEGEHSIKPMSRLQLQKYHELMKYKKLMSERNHLKINKGLAEGGALRHIAPILADRLVDAPSIRLAALARLIAMAKHRQKIIDVTASKKTLPGGSPSLPAKYSPQDRPKMAATLTSPLVTPNETPNAKLTSDEISSPKAAKIEPLPSMTISKTANAAISPVNSNSVLVSSGKHVLIPSFARISNHDTEAHPAVESSKLLPKTVLAEYDNLIDPSDVTRSQLSKPDRPSITQVMNLLGNQNGSKSGSKRNATGAIEISAVKTTGHEDNRNKISGKIVKSFFKQPTQSATSIRASITDLGNMLTERTPTEKRALGNNLRTRGKISMVKGAVNVIHDEEAGNSSLQVKTTRNIIRTLKTDTNAADLLLRKRSEIPRIKRRLRKRKKKNKLRNS